MKTCSACKEQKPLTEFHKQSRRKGGLHCYCKLCTREKNRVWVVANRERQAAACAAWYVKNKQRANRNATNWHYKTNYGITYDEFLERCALLGNRCEVCAESLVIGGRLRARSAHLDHCHKSGKIRGVLCSLCNTALGKFNDSPELLRRAAAYLEERA